MVSLLCLLVVFCVPLPANGTLHSEFRVSQAQRIAKAVYVYDSAANTALRAATATATRPESLVFVQVARCCNSASVRTTSLRLVATNTDTKPKGGRTADLPARGEPNGSGVRDNGNGKGQIRDYGADGKAETDYDLGHDHGAGDPHAHDWDWTKTPPRQPGRPMRPGEGARR